MRINRYWISWYQPTTDYRPLYDSKKEKEPLNKLYWCSGQRGDGQWTMCAVVDAKNGKEAKKTVQKYWPEAEEWRFCSLKDRKFMPGDRFSVTP